MANREKHNKKISKSSGGNSGIAQPQGVHAVAVKLQYEKKVSKKAAYKKAIELCKTPMNEIKKIAESLEIHTNDLLPS